MDLVHSFVGFFFCKNKSLYVQDPLLAYWAQSVQQLLCSAHKIKCHVMPAAWLLQQIEEMTCLTDNIQCWGMLGKFTLILSAIKSAVPFMSANLVSLIKSMCKKFQYIDLLHILVFYISFCNDKIISA